MLLEALERERWAREVAAHSLHLSAVPTVERALGVHVHAGVIAEELARARHEVHRRDELRVALARRATERLHVEDGGARDGGEAYRADSIAKG